MAQNKCYELFVKDDERKDVKSTTFQYKKVMGLIGRNRNQLEKATDPDYMMNMLQKRTSRI